MNVKGDVSYSPCAGGQKMSSSLKERLKRCSRNGSSPVLKANAQTSFSIMKCTTVLTSKSSSSAIKPVSLNDIDACIDQEQLQQMHCTLKSQVMDKEETLRKLQLVERYHLKNKPDDLVNLIQKWLTVSQDALRQLHEKLPERKPDFLQLLRSLNIDCDLIQYDPDSDTFK